MGYTHYLLGKSEKIPQEIYEAVVCEMCRALVVMSERIPDFESFINDKDEQPEFFGALAEKDAERMADICLAGSGFHINFDGVETLAVLPGQGKCSFCKTGGRLPMDTVVVALMAAAETASDGFFCLESDGGKDGLEEGRSLYRKTLGSGQPEYLARALVQLAVDESESGANVASEDLIEEIKGRINARKDSLALTLGMDREVVESLLSQQKIFVLGNQYSGKLFAAAGLSERAAVANICGAINDEFGRNFSFDNAERVGNAVFNILDRERHERVAAAVHEFHAGQGPAAPSPELPQESETAPGM